MSFYNIFIALCKQHGVSPSSVAREVGLNNSSVTYWKRGSQPKTSTIEKLAEYFHVSPSFLMGMEQRLSNNLPDSEKQEIGQEIWELYKNFSDVGLLERLLATFGGLSRYAKEKVVNYTEDLAKIEEYKKI